jgi:hypothetical protein
VINCQFRRSDHAFDKVITLSTKWSHFRQSDQIGLSTKWSNWTFDKASFDVPTPSQCVVVVLLMILRTERNWKTGKHLAERKTHLKNVLQNFAIWNFKEFDLQKYNELFCCIQAVNRIFFFCTFDKKNLICYKKHVSTQMA